jgi:hypothetical protein
MPEQYDFEGKSRIPREMSLSEFRLLSLEKWKEEVVVFLAEQVKTNSLLQQNCALLQSSLRENSGKIGDHSTEIDRLFDKIDAIPKWVVGTGIGVGLLFIAFAALFHH